MYYITFTIEYTWFFSISVGIPRDNCSFFYGIPTTDLISLGDISNECTNDRVDDLQVQISY